MEINKKRYNDLDSFFKRKFKKKIIKLPLDGGFTCPNRDGTISNEGCIFCSDRGTGEWSLGADFSIPSQIRDQKAKLSKPGRKEGYLAYFQNFTNTYGEIHRLRNLYEEALAEDDIVGISIATRGDCLSDEVLDLLAELNQKTFLIVELGMQSVNPRTIELINRGYDQEVFDKAVVKLKNLGINVLVHIIVGLPYETYEDWMADVDYINHRKFWGVKIHNLFVEKDSRLLDFYKENNLSYLMTREDYVKILAAIIRRVDKDIVINRLTGDGIRDKIAYPDWSKNKAGILSSLDKYMKDKNYRQGDLWTS